MKAEQRFQMQSWRKGELGAETREWEPMEHGVAAQVWRPRASADDAIAKCLTWTGRIGIPAMQVVDLSTGEVVWRDSRCYPDAGEPVPASRHEWERVSSIALDPAAGEVGAEKNLIHPGWSGSGRYRGAHGSPLCEWLTDGHRRCGGEAVGPYDHFCYRHWFEGSDELWPIRQPQLTLEEWYFDDRLPRIEAGEIPNPFAKRREAPRRREEDSSEAPIDDAALPAETDGTSAPGRDMVLELPLIYAASCPKSMNERRA